MRTPEALETLVDHGIVEEVVRPLMSGKEAQVYLVRSGGELRVAKVYKEAQQRSFKQRAEYTDGRTTRNSRDRRAIAKHTAYGRKQDEAAWKSAEVDAIYRLSAAGVRVPVPHHFIDGVLLMELVRDHEGLPASRLGDLEFAPEVVQRIFDILLASVVRMLCAGVVHGDLSEFNVLMAADGPVIIDFPQAVDPATNLGARKLLIRDVDNLQRFIGRHVRTFRPRPYAQEMWELYQQNLLTPETQLQGRVTATSRRPTDTSDVLAAIGDAERQHRRRAGGPKVEVIPGRAGPRPGMNEGPRQGPRSGQAAPRTNEGPRTGPPRHGEAGPRGHTGEPRAPRPAAGQRPGEGPRGPRAQSEAGQRSARPRADSEAGQRSAPPRSESEGPRSVRPGEGQRPGQPRSEPEGPRSVQSGEGQRPARPRSEPEGPRAVQSGEGQRPARPRSESEGPRSVQSGEGQRPARPRSESEGPRAVRPGEGQRPGQPRSVETGQRPAQPRPNVEGAQRGPKVVAPPQPGQRPGGPAGEQTGPASSGRRRRRRSRGGRSDEPGGGDRSSAETR